MRLLIKLATRERPRRAASVVDSFVMLASGDHELTFVLSVDDDDQTVGELSEALLWPVHLHVGKRKNKVEAINRDINRHHEWDILIIAEDDAWVVMQDYDKIIVQDMRDSFPDFDGFLQYARGDGNLDGICSSIMGKPYYERTNYVYYPGYKTWYCDNEAHRVATLLGKCKRSEKTLIQHRNPVYASTPEDQLFRENMNEELREADKRLCLSRAHLWLGGGVNDDR